MAATQRRPVAAVNMMPTRPGGGRTSSVPSLLFMVACGYLLCLSVGGAHGARALREWADTDVAAASSAGANPAPARPGKVSVFAHAGEAEARANALSTGLHHNEATMVVVAGDALPAAREIAVTHGGARASGGPPGAAVHAFGPVAMAITDTGYRAFAGSKALPARPEGAPSEAASGSTTSVWEPSALRRGGGKTGDVFTDSVAVTDSAPTAAGMSNVGGGPIAIAAAGEATAVSNADTPANDRTPNASKKR